jgi:hypothetical protein
MTKIKHFNLGAIAAFLLIQGLLGLSLVSDALALTPEDLIVVFNTKVPESRQLAAYYAQKRRVPPENLVGVEVSQGESMSRQEYDQELLPPLRRKVVELRRRYRNPALVLVYGIPLRVGGAVLTEPEKELQALVKSQSKKSTSQAWERLKELEALLTRLPGKPQVSGTGPTSQDVFNLAENLLPRANRWLTWPSDRKTPQETRSRVAALAAQLSTRLPDEGKETGRTAKKESGKYDVPLLESMPAPEEKRPTPSGSLAEQARQWGAQVSWGN